MTMNAADEQPPTTEARRPWKRPTLTVLGAAETEQHTAGAGGDARDWILLTLSP
jgi:hypothetical protein